MTPSWLVSASANAWAVVAAASCSAGTPHSCSGYAAYITAKTDCRYCFISPNVMKPSPSTSKRAKISATLSSGRPAQMTLRPAATSAKSTRPLPSLSNRSYSAFSTVCSFLRRSPAPGARGSKKDAQDAKNPALVSSPSGVARAAKARTARVMGTSPRPVSRRISSTESASRMVCCRNAPAPLEYQRANSSKEMCPSWLVSASSKALSAVATPISSAVTPSLSRRPWWVSKSTLNTATMYLRISSGETCPSPSSSRNSHTVRIRASAPPASSAHRKLRPAVSSPKETVPLWSASKASKSRSAR
mmetsp:Transcript_1999/g.3135  ORF Transcript_1999/g.3135 Transcript_1999/m.3135 type:complete len:303 (+) Transcript_1999:996-1904(+)